MSCNPTKRSSSRRVRRVVSLSLSLLGVAAAFAALWAVQSPKRIPLMAESDRTASERSASSLRSSPPYSRENGLQAPAELPRRTEKIAVDAASGTALEAGAIRLTSWPTSKVGRTLGFPQQRPVTRPPQSADALAGLRSASQSSQRQSSQRQMSEEPQLSLSDLPPVCQTGLPGIDYSNRSTPSSYSLGHQRNARVTDDLPVPSYVPTPHFSPPQHFAPTQQSTSHLRHAPATAASFNPHRNAPVTTTRPQDLADGVDPHAEVFCDTLYPSAKTCAKCHQQIYDEWATSSHAYAAVSPMFHRFEQTINDLSQGTIGYFCVRCHAPVATTMGQPRDRPIWEGPEVFREGVTCVVCHRVNERYGKVNGERRIEPGSIYDPVMGTGEGNGIAEVIRDKDYYKVKNTPDRKGQAIHRRSIQFEQLSQSDFCVSCHQVSVYPGIKLEVVWDQYVASPAYRDGITCQDCHMGRVPGVPDGYAIGPAAIVNDKAINANRRHSNHSFYGPGYSIAHPGIFPQHKDQHRWTFVEWLEFDWRSGWGTDAFEDALDRGEFACTFPPAWQNVDDRYDAREIIEENLEKLRYKRELRRQVLENGSHIDGPFFKSGHVENGNRVFPAGKPLRFNYVVKNLNSGHNLPTGSLGAQPQVWLNVVLVDPMGQRVWESGYLDSWGDLADLQSQDVLDGRLPHDDQLFNLQTKFLITNVKGTDREVPLPINWDVDQLPFLRPSGLPVSVLNHPPLIRMEAHSIPPLGCRDAKYRIPGERLCMPGTYRLSVRMRTRAEPIYFMKFVKATPAMMRAMNEGICDTHAYTVTFEVR